MPEADPKNSQLREATKDYFYKTAEAIHNHFPGLTANQLTMFRAVASIASTEAIIKSEDKPYRKLAGVLGYIAFELADGVDGNLANIRAMEVNEPTNLRGNLYDTLSDKTVETYDCFRVAYRSMENGDRIGAILNILAGITSAHPATARAKAEAENIVVKENGLGTRPVRSTCIGLNIAFGNNKHISRVLGATILAMNLHTTRCRISALRDDESKHIVGPLNNDRKQLEARLRYPSLVAFSAISAGIGIRKMQKMRVMK
jgi:hypothetical protein